MKHVQKLISLSALLLVSWIFQGCGGGNENYELSISTPDQVARDSIKILEIYAIISDGNVTNCQSLMEGSSRPSDSNVQVEGSESISDPATSKIKPLKIPKNHAETLLFFGQGEDANGTVIYSGCTEAKPGENLHQVSIALSQTFIITFDGDGAITDANPKSMMVTLSATSLDRLPNPPTKIGYTFSGWYTEKNGGGAEFTVSTKATSSMTVYAKWVCMSENDLAFCQRLGKNCGSVTDFDSCGNSRVVANCGTCTLPLICNGGGIANICGCEMDAAFCSRLGKNCDAFTGTDNCGQPRTANCGSCNKSQICGGGIPNVCGYVRLVSVPDGTFQRNSGTGDTSYVSAFLMSQTEITQAQYEAIIGSNPSNFTGDDTRPVEEVSWYDALVFCNKLSKAENLTPVYSIKVNGVDNTNPDDWIAANGGTVPTGSSNSIWDAVIADWNANGYRLPTEMEWMWAAMGATAGGVNVGTTGYTKAFAGSNGSNTIGQYAVFGYYTTETGRTTTASTNFVMSKSPNELNLFDMSGNVGEWSWDWADSASWPSYDTAIAEEHVTNYVGPASGTNRVIRGGGWNDFASCVTVGFRDSGGSGGKSDLIGFRVVRR